MAKVHTMQTSFLLGEVSPKSLGDVQAPEYARALKTLENAIVTPQGGVRKRMGTRLKEYTVTDMVLESTSALLWAAVDFYTLNSRTFRLFKFSTSDLKTWWIIANGGNLSEWSILDVENERLYPLVADKSTSDVFGYNAWASYAECEIATTNDISFSSVNLEEMQIEQSGDVLFIVHSSIIPLTVRYLRTSHFDTTPASNFAFPLVSAYHSAFQPRGIPIAESLENHQLIPFLELNQENNYGNGYISHPAVAYANGTLGINLTSGSGIFTSAWVGTFIRFTDLTSNLSCLFYITAYTNSTTVVATKMQGTCYSGGVLNYGTAANTYWEESAWSPKNGYPRAVCAYANRIIYLGTPANPNRIWCSAVGDVDELCEIPYAQDAAMATYLNDNSRAFYIDIIGADLIQWASVGKRIFIGARNKEFVLYSPTNDFGPDTYVIETATTNGSAYRQPVRSSSEVIYVQRSLTRVRSMVFSFQEDDYKSQDLTKNAEHIARTSISNIAEDSQTIPSFAEMVLQTSPDSRIWLRDINGGLSSCTFDRELGQVGWARHKIGGIPTGSGVTNPYVAALGVAYNSFISADDVYVLVKRELDGTGVVCLEVIGNYLELEGYTHSKYNPAAGYEYKPTRAIFMDCTVFSYETVATATHTFAALANETVSIFAEGEYLGEYELDGSGNVTLDRTYNEVLAGYLFETKIETVDYEVPNASTLQGMKKLLYELKLRLYRTSHCLVKKSGQASYQTIHFTEDSTASDGPVALFTGDKTVNVGNVGDTLSVTISHSYPTPFELLGLIFKVEVS